MVKVEINCVWVDNPYRKARAAVRYPVYAYSGEYVVHRDVWTGSWTVEDAKIQLEQLRKDRFILAMKDFWNTHDYEADREMGRIIDMLVAGIEAEG